MDSDQDLWSTPVSTKKHTSPKKKKKKTLHSHGDSGHESGTEILNTPRVPENGLVSSTGYMSPDIPYRDPYSPKTGRSLSKRTPKESHKQLVTMDTPDNGNFSDVSDPGSPIIPLQFTKSKSVSRSLSLMKLRRGKGLYRTDEPVQDSPSKKRKRSEELASASDDEVLSESPSKKRRKSGKEIESVSHNESLPETPKITKHKDGRRKHGHESVDESLSGSPRKRLDKDSRIDPDATTSVSQRRVTTEPVPPHMRYEAPENYGEVEITDDLTVWKEELEDEDVELWLCQIPTNFDINQLNGKQITIGDESSFKGKRPHKSTQEKRIGDSKKERHRIKVRHQALDEAVASCSLVAPSSEDGNLHLVCKNFCGHMSVTESAKPRAYTLPEIHKKVKRKLPPGLKQRHIPFGADAPIVTSHEKKKKNKKHKKHKKHKTKGH